MNSIDIFKHSAYILYRYPILFLLPSIGSVISIITETIFVLGLHNNNNQNYFSFSDIVVLLLFLIAFVITYFQLAIIARRVMLKTVFTTKSYNVKVIDLFLIYSIYSFAVINVGGYENDIRQSFALKLDTFSLYTFKVNSYPDIVAIIVPSGIFIVLLSAIISIFFNAWMVEYIVWTSTGGDQITSRYGLYESLKNVFDVIITEKGKKRNKMAILFLVTIPILILGFILTNISVVTIVDSLNLYMLQFVISSVIDAFYSSFFTVCLFLILLTR
jgi:hypothetical protein